MQLVDKNVFVITPLKGVSTIAIYNEEAVFAKLGVMPTQIPDLKALMGDASDNYHGAKGIGPKTAVKLLNQFQSVENMLGKIDRIKEERIRNVISEHIENIELSKQLATISRDVDVDCELASAEYKGFKSDIRTGLERLQLFSLIGRLFGAKNNKVPAKKLEDKPIKKSKKELNEESKLQLDLF
jgi:DNA polymerase-1